jgi:cytochrome c553
MYTKPGLKLIAVNDVMPTEHSIAERAYPFINEFFGVLSKEPSEDAKYLLEQMNAITDGTRLAGPDERGYPRTQGMKDIMHLASAEERAAIAKFLASQPAPKPVALNPPPDSERLAAGKDAYVKGGCTTCHGADGLKPLASYPLLGGQKRDYLVLQMTEIRGGIRKGGKVAAMVPFAKKLDDAKIGLIADYLSQVERSPK